MTNNRKYFKNAFFVKCTVLLGLAVTLALACAPRPKSYEQEEHEELKKAYRLIDQGRADAAIEILSPCVEREPRKESYRVALASAHASRAGLNVVRFHAFAQSFLEEPKDEGRTSGSQMVKSVALLHSVLDRFDRLPLIETKMVEHLDHAIDVLESVEVPTRGLALYRAVLRAVRLKFELNEKLLPGLYVTKNKECTVNLTRFQKSCEELSVRGVLVIADLALAYPAQKESLERARSVLKDLSINVSKVLEEYGAYIEPAPEDIQPDSSAGQVQPQSNSDKTGKPDKPNKADRLDKKVTWKCE